MKGFRKLAASVALAAGVTLGPDTLMMSAQAASGEEVQTFPVLTEAANTAKAVAETAGDMFEQIAD